MTSHEAKLLFIVSHLMWPYLSPSIPSIVRIAFFDKRESAPLRGNTKRVSKYGGQIIWPKCLVSSASWLHFPLQQNSLGFPLFIFLTLSLPLQGSQDI